MFSFRSMQYEAIYKSNAHAWLTVDGCFIVGNLVLDIFRAPIQIIIGILYGVLFGATLWLIPLHNRYCVSADYSVLFVF